jgi:hypothetical protein
MNGNEIDMNQYLQDGAVVYPWNGEGYGEIWNVPIFGHI